MVNIPSRYREVSLNKDNSLLDKELYVTYSSKIYVPRKIVSIDAWGFDNFYFENYELLNDRTRK